MPAPCVTGWAQALGASRHPRHKARPRCRGTPCRRPSPAQALPHRQPPSQPHRRGANPTKPNNTMSQLYQEIEQAVEAPKQTLACTHHHVVRGPSPSSPASHPLPQQPSLNRSQRLTTQRYNTPHSPCYTWKSCAWPPGEPSPRPARQLPWRTCWVGWGGGLCGRGPMPGPLVSACALVSNGWVLKQDPMRLRFACGVLSRKGRSSRGARALRGVSRPAIRGRERGCRA